MFHKIYLKIQSYANDIFTIVFNDIASFHFFEKMGENRFKISNPDEGNWKELTSIGYYKNGTGNIIINSEDPWVKEWASSANFAVEI